MSDSAHEAVRLGQAAHITAAAPGGPRYDPSLTPEARGAAENGIWLCLDHARLIDRDVDAYSAQTLRMWKQQAEQQAAAQLRGTGEALPLPTTLVALGRQVVFEGIWTGGDDARWSFRVVRFVWGTMEGLRTFVENWKTVPRTGRFVVVESEGDGRVVNASPAWSYQGNQLEVVVPVMPRARVTDPRERGSDLAISDGWDLGLENGDLKIVHGVDAARQSLRLLMSTPFGEPISPDVGSAFGEYWPVFRHDLTLLARLFVLEAARLATIPYQDELTGQVTPLLDCLRRVESVRFGDVLPEQHEVRAHLAIEWGHGERESVSLLISTGAATEQ